MNGDWRRIYESDIGVWYKDEITGEYKYYNPRDVIGEKNEKNMCYTE